MGPGIHLLTTQMMSRPSTNSGPDLMGRAYTHATAFGGENVPLIGGFKTTSTVVFGSWTWVDGTPATNLNCYRYAG